MTESGRNWQLLRGDTVLGTIVQTDSDYPWRNGTFTPSPAFAEFAPLFAAAQSFTDRDEYDTPESDAAFNAIFDLGLSIRDVDGDELFGEVMLNLTDSDVSWRC
ncbi:hypothetical protein CA13_31670 [Planctomycetes bacterium CA13]|uniref:Uncharacterized protein n=1 Tax=Novipirellula herctigrandis TaxID=2527986 RepID=A0A5C5Z363_9BACT|nr:hypothetical protein CA13_31670 [Planctomycetes bacterium CA13]